MEQLGAGSGTECVEALTEFALDVLQVHVDRTHRETMTTAGGKGASRLRSATSVEGWFEIPARRSRRKPPTPCSGSVSCRGEPEPVVFVTAAEAARHGIDIANNQAGQVFHDQFGEVCRVV